MICELQVLDPSGHIQLVWDPSDPESVAKAKAEADKLLEAGFAFFATTDPEVASPGQASADIAPEQVREFQPQARRQVAVPQMRGG